MNEKLISLIKLICITYLIIFLPRIISKQGNNSNTSVSNETSEEKSSFQNFLNNDNFRWMKQIKIGIIANEKVINQSIIKNLESAQKNGFKIQAIIYPKSHSKGKTCKNTSLNNSIKTYQWVYKTNKFPTEAINNIDAFIFDLQDNGLKNSKTFKVLLKIIETSAANNKKLIILDKPNPLEGYMEGPGQIPLRHGITLGEMAIYLNKFTQTPNVHLVVIPMINWKRNFIRNAQKSFDRSSILEKKLLRILNQIKPINEGCNSKQKAQAILLPKNQALSSWEHEYLKKLCLKSGLSCKNYSTFFKSSQLKGIKIKLKKEVSNFSIYNTFLTIIRFLNNRKNINLLYPSNFNEDSDLGGTKEFLQGTISFEDLKKETEASLCRFYSQAKNCFLYSPFPKMISVNLIRI